MFDSQTIQKYGTSPDTVIYSPWFPRGGDYGLFTLEVAAVGGTSPLLKVALVQKNSSIAGDGTAIGTGTVSFELGSAGRITVDFKAAIGGTSFAGFEELVRYRFTLSGGATAVTSWVTFRMLGTTWYDKV